MYVFSHNSNKMKVFKYVFKQKDVKGERFVSSLKWYLRECYMSYFYIVKLTKLTPPPPPKKTKSKIVFGVKKRGLELEQISFTRYTYRVGGQKHSVYCYSFLFSTEDTVLFFNRKEIINSQLNSYHALKALFSCLVLFRVRATNIILKVFKPNKSLSLPSSIPNNNLHNSTKWEEITNYCIISVRCKI